MSRLLSLSRASQLVGLPRATLQRLIRDGELASFDGMVTAEELLRAFPGTGLDDPGLTEAVAHIREEAFGRRLRERALPSQEILAQRIFNQSAELAELRRHLQAYHALLQSALDALERQPSSPQREELRALLEDGLAAVLASDPDQTLEVMQDMLKMVSSHVTVRPSGRDFVVEGNDTVLQAGLKAGLRLNYGCGSGSCGLCKARLVSGEVRQVAHADYLLSEAERASGHLLTCVCAPVTDLVIETLEATGPADIPHQEIVASVRAVKPLGRDTLLLHLQTPRSNRLRFLAGQGVTLGISTPAGDLSATYPIASCPCDDRNLHFHLARDPTDAFAAQVFDGALANGAPVSLRGPMGDFILAQASPRPLVFLACDAAFGPVKSLIEHALAVDEVDTFGLVWAATRDDGHYLDNQGRMWAAAFDRFAYHPVAGADASTAARAAAASAATLDFLPEADVYIAGPAEFVALARAEFERLGLASAKIASAII